jgi:hypothetical protein
VPPVSAHWVTQIIQEDEEAGLCLEEVTKALSEETLNGSGPPGDQKRGASASSVLFIKAPRNPRRL